MEDTIWDIVTVLMVNLLAMSSTLYSQSLTGTGVKCTKNKLMFIPTFSLVVAASSHLIVALTGADISVLMLVMLAAVPSAWAWKKGESLSYYVKACIKAFLFYALTQLSAFCGCAFFGMLDPKYYDSALYFGLTFWVVYIIVIDVTLYLIFIKPNIEARLDKTDTLMMVMYFGMMICLVLPVMQYLLDTSTHDKLFAVGFTFVLFIPSAAVVEFLLFCFPAIFFKNIRARYLEAINAKTKSDLDSQIAAGKAYRAAQEDTIRFRHEVKNNLLTLSLLLRKQDYAEAESYLSSLLGTVSSLSPRFATGDEMLDTILFAKAPDLDKLGIDLTVNGVADGGIGWEPADISTVFSNLINNAAEACEKVAPSDRYITITIKRTEYRRAITVANSTAERVDCKKLSADVRYTSKADSSRHGFGVHNILTTAAKYDAAVKMECDGSQFRTTITTQIK